MVGGSAANEGGNKNHLAAAGVPRVERQPERIGRKWKCLRAGTAEVEMRDHRDIWAKLDGDHGGVGRFHAGDIVRMLWPTAFCRTRLKWLATNSRVHRDDRRGSSCPTLFVWTVQKYRLMRMCSGRGAGALGGLQGNEIFRDPRSTSR